MNDACSLVVQSQWLHQIGYVQWVTSEHSIRVREQLKELPQNRKS